MRKPSDAQITDALAPIRARRVPPRHGYECGSSVPYAPSVGAKKPPSLEDRVRQLIRSREVARAAEDAGKETWDEANDFDVGDDYEPDSPYEMELDGIPKEQIAAERAEEARIAAKAKKMEEDRRKPKNAASGSPNASKATLSDNGADAKPRRERSDPQSSSETNKTDDLVDILKRLGYGA